MTRRQALMTPAQQANDANASEQMPRRINLTLVTLVTLYYLNPLNNILPAPYGRETIQGDLPPSQR